MTSTTIIILTSRKTSEAVPPNEGTAPQGRRVVVMANEGPDWDDTTAIELGTIPDPSSPDEN